MEQTNADLEQDLQNVQDDIEMPRSVTNAIGRIEEAITLAARLLA